MFWRKRSNQNRSFAPSSVFPARMMFALRAGIFTASNFIPTIPTFAAVRANVAASSAAFIAITLPPRLSLIRLLSARACAALLRVFPRCLARFNRGFGRAAWLVRASRSFANAPRFIARRGALSPMRRALSRGGRK